MTHRLANLIANVADALRLRPPNYFRSVFGDPDTWAIDQVPPSEIGLLRAGPQRRVFDEIARVVVPALPIRTTGPGFPGASLLFRPCKVLVEHLESDAASPMPDEAWMFVNGICTDEAVVRINARYITKLFQRPLVILFDPTCGLVPDLLECALGKGWGSLTAAGRLALPPLAAALVNPGIRRVVVLAHSRGTIIVASVLHALARALARDASEHGSGSAEARAGARLYRDWRTHSAPFQRALRHPEIQAALSLHGSEHRPVEPARLKAGHLGKLEIYAIANCASDMRYVTAATEGEPATPYIESHGNENDLVARLGVLARRKGAGKVQIDGHCYERPVAWGHLLNAHYLFPLKCEVDSGLARLIPIEGTRQPPRLPALFANASQPAADALKDD